MRFLDESERFRNWLHDANPDVGLVRTYVDAVTAKGWSEKLPTKSARFVLATGLGMLADAIVPTGLGTVGGVAVGAADTFYLDQIIKGWRPNQFIEGPYKSFVTGDQLKKAS